MSRGWWNRFSVPQPPADWRNEALVARVAGSFSARVCCLPIAFCLSLALGGCGQVEPPHQAASGPTAEAALRDKGLLAFGGEAEWNGGASRLHASLRPVFWGADRQTFDAQAWKLRSRDSGGTEPGSVMLWRLVLTLDATSTKSLSLPDLRLETGTGVDPLAIFAGPREGSQAGRVYDPVDSLFAAPEPELAPGDTVAIPFLGPRTMNEPVLSAGAERLPFQPLDWDVAQMGQEVPLIPLEAPENPREDR